MAKVNKDIAIAQYEKAIRRPRPARSPIFACQGRATLGEQLRAQAAQTNAAQITFNLADLRYRSGATSYLDVLDAQRTLFAAQQATRSRCRPRRSRTWLTLYKVLGGWTEPGAAAGCERGYPPDDRRAAAARAMNPATHRAQLVGLLAEAAEIEHCLMCTYLYAAFSLKQSADEGLEPDELAAVKRWRREIIAIATDEMPTWRSSTTSASPSARPTTVPTSRSTRACSADIVVELAPLTEETLITVYLERPADAAEDGELPEGPISPPFPSPGA